VEKSTEVLKTRQYSCNNVVVNDTVFRQTGKLILTQIPILMPVGAIDGWRCRADTRPKQKVWLAVCDFLQLGLSIATNNLQQIF